MDGATESAPSVDDAADSASAAPEVDAAPEASVAVATKEVQVGTGQGLDQRWRPHAMRPPQVRLGTTQVNGRLPPEILQRIVRQHFGQYLECYKQGLRNNPTLVGRVSVKLVIQRDGSVGTAADGGSDLPDQSVVQCVVRHFTNLQFPQPEGGIVTAVFPLIFSPGDQ